MFGLNHRDVFLITRILLLSRSECALKPMFKNNIQTELS